jgi:hypothetical protein
VRKKVSVICLTVALAVLLVAAFVPSCTPTEKGTIEVKATLCGEPWQGQTSYTLTLAGGASPINGTEVPKSFANVDAGNWTCAYVSGGPAGAFLAGITPSATQSLSAGGTITFTLNFELKQDAVIQWYRWTANGEPIVGQGGVLEYWAQPCQIIDAHFKQWVDGCCGYKVTLNETSVLRIKQIAGPAGVQVYVANDDCAVNKTAPPQGVPPVKKSQIASHNRRPVEKGTIIDLPFQTPTDLDVGTVWELTKCLNYTKSINWLGISTLPFEPPGHGCVVFELLLPRMEQAVQYVFELVAFADVALPDAEDVDPWNNHAESPTLTLVVNVPVPG